MSACQSSSNPVDSFFGTVQGQQAFGSLGNTAIQTGNSGYNFGTVTIGGSPVSTSITLTNSSSSALYIASVTGALNPLTNAADPNFSVTSIQCPISPASFSPGAVCSFAIRFAPAVYGPVSFKANIVFGLTPGDTQYSTTASASGNGTGQISLGLSTFIIGAATLVSSTATPLTLTLKDASGNTITDPTQAPNLSFLVLSTGTSGASVGPITAVSGNPGLYQAQLTGTAAGTINTLRANFAGLGNLTASPSFTVLPGPANAANSTITASVNPVAANGAATSTITVTLLDAYSNPAANKTVTLASSRGGTDTVSGSATSNASGVATFTVKSSTSGTSVYTATDSTDSVVPLQTVAVVFSAGAVNPGSTTVVAVPTTNVVANNSTTSTVTVTLLDFFSNPVSGKTVSLASSRPTKDTVTAITSTTGANGVAVFNVQSTASGASVYTATDVTDSSLLITNTASVSYIAGSTSQTVSTTTPSPASLVADGVTTTTITVTVTDAYSNPISGKTVTLASSRGASDTISAASGNSDSNGHVTFTVKSAVLGTATLTATDTTDSLAFTQTAAVTFTTVPIATLSFTSGQTNAALCTLLAPQPTVTAYDGNSNVDANSAATNITLAVYTSLVNCQNAASPIGGGVTATTNPVALSSGVATFSGVKIQAVTATYLGASDGGGHTACAAITPGNPITITSTPANQVYPLSSNANPPIAQSRSSYQTFAAAATSACGSVTWSCTYTTPGLSATDPNYVATATSCASLPSLGAATAGSSTFSVTGTMGASNYLGVGTAAFSSSTLNWWPTALQRGTYQFAIAATDTTSGLTKPAPFSVTVRENYATPTALLLGLDAQVSTNVTGLGASIPAAPASGSTASWFDLNALLSGQTVAGPSWVTTGTSSSPYSQSFGGVSGDYLGLGSAMGSNTTMGFSTWVNPTSVSTASSVILGNLGTSVANNGIVLKQSDTQSGRAELQLGGGPALTYNSTVYKGYPAVVLADAPSAYYRLSESSGTNATDVTTNGYTATYSGTGITYSATGALAPADTNGAIGLTSTSSGTITVPATAMNANTGSVEFWVNPGFSTTAVPSTGYSYAMFSRSRVTANHTNFDIIYSSSKQLEAFEYTTAYVGNICTGTASPKLTQGVWSQIVMTYNVTTNFIQLYANGSLFCSFTPTNALTALDAAGVTKFGTQDAYALVNSGQGDYFPGSFDEAAFYPYVLSSGQIQAHYQAGLAQFYPNPVLAAQPQGYWRLGESGGTIAYDISGNGNHGAYSSAGVTYGASGALTGDSDTAATFDGSLGYVAAESAATAAFSNGTISAWIKTSGTGNCGSGFCGIVVKQNAYNLYLSSNVLGMYDFGSSTWRSTGINLANNSWHQVAATFQSGVTNGTTIYVDGLPQLTTTMTTTTQAQALFIGTTLAGTQQFVGSIDDAALFNYLLTPQQIANMYNYGGFTKCMTTQPLSNNAWSFLSGFWDGTNLELFANGQKQCQIQPGANYVYSSPSTNLYAAATSTNTANWAGSMADLKLYGTSGAAPLSAATIQGDFNATADRFRTITSNTNAAPVGVPDIVTSGLVLNLDAANANQGLGPNYSGASGTCLANQLDWQDLSPSAFLGGLVSFSGCGSSQGWTGNGATASPYALTFNGTSNGVAVPDTASLQLTSQGSMETWAKIANVNQTAMLEAKRNPSSLGQFTFFVTGTWNGGSSGKNIAFYEADAANTQAVVTNSNVVDGNWHHLVATWNSGATPAMHIYVDGADAAVTTNTVGGSWPTPNTAGIPLVIGAAYNTSTYLYPITGSIGVARVYSAPLTQPQARQNCNALASRYGVTCQ